MTRKRKSISDISTTTVRIYLALAISLIVNKQHGSYLVLVYTLALSKLGRVTKSLLLENLLFYTSKETANKYIKEAKALGLLLGEDDDLFICDYNDENFMSDLVLNATKGDTKQANKILSGGNYNIDAEVKELVGDGCKGTLVPILVGMYACAAKNISQSELGRVFSLRRETVSRILKKKGMPFKVVNRQLRLTDKVHTEYTSFTTLLRKMTFNEKKTAQEQTRIFVGCDGSLLINLRNNYKVKKKYDKTTEEVKPAMEFSKRDGFLKFEHDDKGAIVEDFLDDRESSDLKVKNKSYRNRERKLTDYEKHQLKYFLKSLVSSGESIAGTKGKQSVKECLNISNKDIKSVVGRIMISGRKREKINRMKNCALIAKSNKIDFSFKLPEKKKINDVDKVDRLTFTKITRRLNEFKTTLPMYADKDKSFRERLFVPQYAPIRDLNSLLNTKFPLGFNYKPASQNRFRFCHSFLKSKFSPLWTMVRDEIIHTNNISQKTASATTAFYLLETDPRQVCTEESLKAHSEWLRGCETPSFIQKTGVEKKSHIYNINTNTVRTKDCYNHRKKSRKSKPTLQISQKNSQKSSTIPVTARCR